MERLDFCLSSDRKFRSYLYFATTGYPRSKYNNTTNRDIGCKSKEDRKLTSTNLHSFQVSGKSLFSVDKTEQGNRNIPLHKCIVIHSIESFT